MFQRTFRYSTVQDAEVRQRTTFVFSYCEFSKEPEIPGLLRIEHNVQAVSPPWCYTIHMGVFSPPARPGVMSTPPLDVATQIRRILCFHFDAFFGASADEVRLYSAASPSQFLPHVFTNNRAGNNVMASHLPVFVNKLLRLERRTYVTVLRCMAAHEHALLSLLHHPELAYSLLVFALETLTQEFDEFQPKWADLASDYRKRIDSTLAKLDGPIVDELRAAIVTSQHLKLQTRVLAFASRYISSHYFTAVGGLPPPRLRRSTLASALKGAYSLRSRYAHTLMQEEDIQARSEVAEVYDSEGRRQVILTILGLQRLLREIVANFIAVQPEVEEPFKYAESVERPPGVSNIPSPEYWLKNIQGLTADTARAYFEGLLYSYDRRMLQKGKMPVPLGVGPDGLFVLSILVDSPPDLDALGRRATELLRGNPKKSQKNALIAIQVICGVQNEFPKGCVPKCTAELLAAIAAQGWAHSPWKAEDCEAAIASLFRREQDSTVIPDLVEVLMCLYVANAWEGEGNNERAMHWLKVSWKEASSYAEIQLAIDHARSVGQALDPRTIFPPYVQAKP
ncbi:MAG TPA: hypothetical protein PKW35_04435 [Nannocystaceae bacterium]|nr:hypothetical protein [Nannocystaceae bacterium]